jgi:hypothetical protein
MKGRARMKNPWRLDPAARQVHYNLVMVKRDIGDFDAAIA